MGVTSRLRNWGPRVVAGALTDVATRPRALLGLTCDRAEYCHWGQPRGMCSVPWASRAGVVRPDLQQGYAWTMMLCNACACCRLPQLLRCVHRDECYAEVGTEA